jgi:hypothetical protein
MRQGGLGKTKKIKPERVMKKILFVVAGLGALTLGACENRSTDSADIHREGIQTGTTYGTGTGTNEGRSAGDPMMATDTLGTGDGTGTGNTGTGMGNQGTGTQGTGTGGTGTQGTGTGTGTQGTRR